MKIGIFGGTFDPIHNAHLIAAQYAREQFGLERVIIMTSGNPPHKQDKITDKAIRHEMTKLAVGDDFEVGDYEVNKQEYSYTLNTLKHFKKLYPNDDLYFIIGEDSLRDIHMWYEPKEILKLCTLLVFPRISAESLSAAISEVSKKQGRDIRAIDAPVIGISSTLIRARVKNGQSIKHMLPEKVMEYIEKNKLYGE